MLATSMIDNPYAAPEAEVPPPLNPGISNSPYGSYREVGGLRTAILVLLGVGLILSAGSILISSMVNEAILSFDSASDDETDRLIEMSNHVGSLQIVLFLITVIFWCIWKNQSCKNAWLFKPAPLRAPFGFSQMPQDVITPGWAAGCYFVPILNLWKPFQAMVFIRNQVAHKLNIGPLVGLWWISYLTMNFASGYFTRDSTDEIYTDAQAIAYNEGLMINHSIKIVATFFAIAIIQKLTVAQQQMAKEKGLTL